MNWIEIRSDKAQVFASLLVNFSKAKLYNVEGLSSYHNPIFLVPKKVEQPNTICHFRFENTWLTEPICKQIIKEGWVRGTGTNIQQKVKICSAMLAVV